MDKNQKFLNRLTPKELAALQIVLEQIQERKTADLDIKKLAGHPDIFRVRAGTIRIIFLANRTTIEILEISRRSEKTYRGF
jgi:mRNA-degrading endonuclease RelE of RelBE toxin-antitoxin system